MTGLVTRVGFDMFHEDLEDKFTYGALQALFQFYKDESESSGEQIEYSPNDIIDEWKEYKNLKEAGKDIFPNCVEDVTNEFLDNHTYEFWVDENTKNSEILNHLEYDYIVIIVEGNNHVLIRKL